MRRTTAILTSFAAVLCISGTALAGASDSVVVKATFDSDLGGWTSNTPNEVVWNASGGNPGGEALFTDGSGNITVLLAPSAFLSPAINYTKLDGKAYISFQHLMVKESGVTGTSPYVIQISGPGGTATFTGAVATVLPKKNKWVTVAVPLLETSWTLNSGDWADLMANVTSMTINMELATNSGANPFDQEAIDNIEIVSHPKGFSIQ